MTSASATWPLVIVASCSLGACAAKAVVVQSGTRSNGPHHQENRAQFKQLGDVITSVDGEPVSSLDDLREILSNRKSGDTVPVEILRDGTKQKLDVRLK